MSATTASLGTLLGRERCLVYWANQAAPAPTAAPTTMPFQPNVMVAAPATPPMKRRYGINQPVLQTVELGEFVERRLEDGEHDGHADS